MRLNNWLGSCEEQFVLEARAERTNERENWTVLTEEFAKAGKATLERGQGKQFKAECTEYLAVLRKFLTTAEKKPARIGAGS